MTMKSYGTIETNRDAVSLRSVLPRNLRQAVMDLIDTGPTSSFYYKIKKGIVKFDIYLIEHNEEERFTVCHCFSTDTLSPSPDNYTYESFSLETFSSISKLLQDVGIA